LNQTLEEVVNKRLVRHNKNIAMLKFKAFQSTPFTNAAVRYTYGWTYMSGDNWGPINNTYIDRPATTGFVEYVVNYRLISGSTVSYVVHQYQEYGYELTEVA
jgi:hypothetical protein